MPWRPPYPISIRTAWPASSIPCRCLSLPAPWARCAVAGAAAAPHYRLAMRAIAGKLHRDLPPTRLWSYGGSVPGVMFETRSGQGLSVEWANELPPNHFLPIDHSLHGAERGTPESRGVVHLHGGKTPAESDGYPEDWYPPGQSRTYYYPNDQDAALLWYHDHSMGINRLNVYAGLLGLHVIRDSAEDALQLPSGKYEVPLVLFDRDLRRDGQLSYPVSADPERPWVPEAFGEAHLVNGKLFPYLDVRAAQVSIPHSERGERALLSAVPEPGRRDPSDRHRPGAAVGAGRGFQRAAGAGGARRPGDRFCRASGGPGAVDQRCLHSDAIPGQRVAGGRSQRSARGSCVRCPASPNPRPSRRAG